MNIFKKQNTTQSSQNTQQLLQNKFKKLQITIDTSNSDLFPELSQISSQKKEEPDLNFLNAISSEEKKPDKTFEMMPGWIYLTKNLKDNKTVWNPPLEIVNINTDNDTNREIILMLYSNWERYKNQYEELHGEEAYDYNHGTYYYEDYDEDIEE